MYSTVPPHSPPSKPNNLSAIEIAPRSINLTWNVPSDRDFSHYEVLLVNESRNEIIHVSQKSLIHELSFSSKYRFKVVAVSVAECLVERSPPSDPLYFSG